jgi:hypothetical protein
MVTSFAMDSPVGVLEFVDGEEDDVYAETRDLLNEGLALFVGGDAENGRLLLLIRHAGSSCAGVSDLRQGVTVIIRIPMDKN